MAQSLSSQGLLLPGESFSSIEAGKCSNCGKLYTLISGSNKTFRKNSQRYIETETSEIGWSAFRCKGCKKLIEETWTPLTD